MIRLPQMVPTHVYVFRDASLTSGGEATVCIADRQVVESRLGKGSAERLFGGAATYATPDGTDFLGVWGTRNASRFRRFLREAGAKVIAHHCRPAKLRLRLKLAGDERPRIRSLTEQ